MDVFNNEDAFINKKVQGVLIFTMISKSSTEPFWPKLLNKDASP